MSNLFQRHAHLTAIVTLCCAAIGGFEVADGFSLRWANVAGGGGTSAGSVELRGSIGQVGVERLVGESVSLQGGFWPAMVDYCPDTNQDAIVDVDDLLLVILDWGCTGVPGGCIGDLNTDGAVDDSDLDAVILYWGLCP